MRLDGDRPPSILIPSSLDPPCLGIAETASHPKICRILARSPQSFQKGFDFLVTYATIRTRGTNGSVPEWLMGADCKSAGYAYAGSNPARPIHRLARVAQW